MTIYYFAHHVYQFSYARPLYEEVGGTFVVRKLKTLLRFKRHLWNPKSSVPTPKVISRPTDNMLDLNGLLISQSNIPLTINHDKCRTVFMGHGTGDKRYGGKATTLEGFQYHFIAGPKHMEKLKDSDINISEDRLIKIGNIRFDDYVNNKINRQEVLDNLGITDSDRKNVLYAPTWRWGNGTFHRYVYQFCKEITKEHNLIVRPHHHDAKHIPKIKLWAKLNGIKHVFFSNPDKFYKNDTMHDFLISDIMISDTSSILYEYLITGKPIIVANTDFKNLHTMPDEMNIMTLADLWNGSDDILSLINKNLYDHPKKKLYKDMLENCFYFNDGKSVERAVNFLKSII